MSNRGVSTSNCYAYFFKYPLLSLFLKSQIMSDFYTSFHFLWGMSLFVHTFSVTAAESGAE